MPHCWPVSLLTGGYLQVFAEYTDRTRLLHLMWEMFGPTFPCVEKARFGSQVDGGKWSASRRAHMVHHTLTDTVVLISVHDMQPHVDADLYLSGTTSAWLEGQGQLRQRPWHNACARAHAARLALCIRLALSNQCNSVCL